jgi:CelD/BcsL family acetyltransferase involved in cellulose biosynthesis
MATPHDATSSQPDVITSPEGLAAIEAEWNALVADNGWSSVFASHAFVTHWYRCFSPPDAVRVYRVKDAGQTVGFLPLALERRGGVRVLSSQSNLHCMHSTPAVKRGAESVFARAATQALAAAGGWDVLEREYDYSFLPVPRVIDAGAATRAGMRIREHAEDTYTIALPSTFDAYLSTHLSANAKKNFRRLANKIDKAGPNRLEVLHGQDAIAAWPEMLRIENAGWKGEAGSSLARADDSFKRHYAGWLELLASRGELSVYFLTLNDRRMAGVFGYVEGDVFHWFKTGYDEAYAEFAPSNVLIVRIIEHLIASDPRVKRFHMFPIDFGYKHRYANEQSTATRTVVYNSSFGGRLAYAKLAARESLRNVGWIRKAVRMIKR